MTDAPRPTPGTIVWNDLTVPDAVAVREFYADVVGWQAEPVKMGEYDDFNMIAPATGEPAAGVCHARGVNAGLPSQWLLYVAVENLDARLARCLELGGTVLRPATKMGAMGRYGVIRDPAGAVMALFESA